MTTSILPCLQPVHLLCIHCWVEPSLLLSNFIWKDSLWPCEQINLLSVCTVNTVLLKIWKPNEADLQCFALCENATSQNGAIWRLWNARVTHTQLRQPATLMIPWAWLCILTLTFYNLEYEMVAPVPSFISRYSYSLRMKGCLCLKCWSIIDVLNRYEFKVWKWTAVFDYLFIHSTQTQKKSQYKKSI